MFNRGKWGKLDTPQRDWVCIDVVDHQEPSVTCEMCESQTIRYGHIMRHQNYSGTLECGCMCSGKMEGDYEAAHQRELKIKRRSPPPKSEAADSWIKAADHLLVFVSRLTDFEKEFVRDMRFRFISLPHFNPSEKQTALFLQIYKKVFNEPAHP